MLFSQGTSGLTYGGTNTESGLCLTHSTDGGIILAGNTRSYGSGSNDIYLIKINEFYQTVWTKVIGSSHQDFARSIITVDDGYVICGESWSYDHGKGGIYLLKVDTQGNVITEKSFGIGLLDNCFDIIETSTDKLLFIGYSRSIDIYGGVYLIMTDKQGNIIWDNTYGFEYDEYAMDVTEDSEGNFLIIGSKNGFFDDVHATYKTHDADMWVLKIDVEGNVLDNFIYGLDGHDLGYSILPDGDGYLLFGSTQSYGEGSFDMYLTKINNQGNEIWNTTFGGAEFDYGISMAKNNEGSTYLLGTTKSYAQQGNTDIYLIKIDDLGEEIWSITIGKEYSDYGYDIISTADNGCAIIGTTTSVDCDTDILFVKISSNGEIESFTDTNDLLANSYNVLPNPMDTEGRLNISDGNIDRYSMEIVNISGISVASYILDSSQPNFSVELLPPGFYIYILKNLVTNKQITGKLAIK